MIRDPSALEEFKALLFFLDSKVGGRRSLLVVLG